MDPEGTSKGMWRVGNGTQELFGRCVLLDMMSFNATTDSPARFARRFDQQSDLHTMRFQLNRYTADQKGNKCHPGACGKGFQLHRRRSWWSDWLSLTGPWCLIILFYPVRFSGVGIFQVKYDGQMRTDEDERSLSCDFHCMRVEKNNSGKVEPATK